MRDAQPALLAEPPRPVRSRRLVYRVVCRQDTRAIPDYYPPGWPILHRFTRQAANVQVSKLAEAGVIAVVQRGRIVWEDE